MSFVSWLKSQWWRDDPVGDLVQDVIADGFTGRDLRGRLCDAHACPGALEALERAREEYELQRHPREFWTGNDGLQYQLVDCIRRALGRCPDGAFQGRPGDLLYIEGMSTRRLARLFKRFRWSLQHLANADIEFSGNRLLMVRRSGPKHLCCDRPDPRYKREVA